MSTPILATKIHIPPPRPELVRRSRLLDQLNSGHHHRLTLISAPAGFGKTTLIITWLQNNDQPAAWLSLDERDSDPARFLTYFIAALQTIDANVGRTVIDILNSGKLPPIETLLTSLLNDIAAVSDDFLLVLDDYHVLESPEIDDALIFLLDHLPAQMHLVIATREDPQFPLARLRVRHQLTEIRGADLRFTPEEAAAFLNQVMGLALSAQDIAALENRTEGWIAGLQLAALSLQERPDTTDFIQAFTGSHRFVVDYLIEEVLHRQPEAIRHFLLRTSILDRLSGELCDAIMMDANSNKLLEQLERSNLFVIALDDQRHWYRYHHLFADALHSYLLTEEPQLISTLHSRAAGYYADAESWDDAIQHALLAGEPDQAAEWVRQTSDSLLRHGDLLTLKKRLASLPDALIERDLTLSLARAWAETLLPLAPFVKIDYDALETQIASASDRSTMQRQSMCAEIQVMRALASDDAATAEVESEKALDMLPDELNHLRPIVVNQIAHIRRYQGRYGEAITAYETVVHSPHTDELTRYIAYANLGRLYQMQNRLADAQAILERAIHRSTTASTPPAQLCFVHVALACVELDHGHLREALAQIEIALPLCKLLNYVETIWYAKWTEAFIYLLRGNPAPTSIVGQGAPNTPEGDSTLAAFHTLYSLRFARLMGDRATMQQALSSTFDVVRAMDITYELETERALAYLALDNPEAAQHIIDSLRKTNAPENELLPVQIRLIESMICHRKGEAASAADALSQAIEWAMPQNNLLPFMTGGDLLADLLETSDPLLDPAQRAFVGQAFERTTAIPADDQPQNQTDLLDPLSDRELDVLRLLCTELSGPEIADQLIISLSTMRTHTRSIYSKLNVNSRRAAVRRAQEIGLL